MTCMLLGAVTNTILDPLFIFGFGWGIQGAAWATVIGQVLSGIMVLLYFCKISPYGSEALHAAPGSAVPQSHCFSWNGLLHQSACHGGGAGDNEQYSAFLRRIFHVRRRYSPGLRGRDLQSKHGVHGNLHRYFPGLSADLGIQLRGKKLRARAKTYRMAFRICLAVGIGFALCFQIFPRQLVSIFGSGSEEYFFILQSDIFGFLCS